MTFIYDVLAKNPLQTTIPNNGVAAVTEPTTAEEEATLIYELQSFVCEGQYEDGLGRILRSFIDHAGTGTKQPAVWVSGFYGSGKSHLVKVLRYLWTDYTFTNGASARGLATLPSEVTDLLRELSTLGKRGSGLHAAAGKLDQELGIRQGLLAILFHSKGLPAEYPIARFVMWLRNSGIYDSVKANVEAQGNSFDRELRDMRVSPLLPKAILAAMPQFAASEAEVRHLLREQYPNIKGDLTDDQMLNTISDLLAVNGQIPCTLIVLDELQQYIGENGDRAYNVQLVAEACSEKFGGRLLFVATGQSAISSTPQLSRIQARFTMQIELSDTDVETVIRKIVLAKKPSERPAIESMLKKYSGEIDKHLRGTKIEPTRQDDPILPVDYPILPVRRRFWEKVLRAVDRPGTAAQLRTQLRVVHEAVRDVAELPLGAVVPGDYIYDQLSTDMLRSSVLPRDIDEIIKKHRDGTPDGMLRSRLCALIFLIGQLPRDKGVDIGIRATPDMLADLLVDNLQTGSTELRKRIPDLLQKLVENNDLMPMGDEYRMQTPVGAAWDRNFRMHFARIRNDDNRIADERTKLLKGRFYKILEGLKIIQGKSKVARKLEYFFGSEQPKPTGTAIPVWVRDEWSDAEGTIKREAQAAGIESPLIFVFIPRRSADDLNNAIAGWCAADETIELNGVPATAEGHEARNAMTTRKEQYKVTRDELIDGIFAGIRVYQGGGNEVIGQSLRDIIEEAANNALARMYPQFGIADDARWPKVIERSRAGSGSPLDALGYTGDVEKHPVCDMVLKFLAGGKKGAEIRKHFEDADYGWPRDAVDAALFALVTADQMTVSQNGAPISRQALDQNKIGVADFKPVTVILTVQQKIAIRKLLQEAGVACKANEEVTAIPGFLTEMELRAGQAGGEAPRPEKPSILHLQELRQKSGNEQAVALFDLRDRLSDEAKTWKAQAKLIEKRYSGWESLEALLNAVTDLPVAVAVCPQVTAIRDTRALLDDPNPIEPLCDQLTDALRQALTRAQQEYQARYDLQIGALTASNTWQQLTTEQQTAILTQEGITGVPALQVATPAQVLDSVQTISLTDWRNRTDALHQRFTNALTAAAKLLAPTTVRVTLPPATLNSEPEVDEYLRKARALLMEEISAGHPVVL